MCIIVSSTVSALRDKGNRKIPCSNLQIICLSCRRPQLLLFGQKVLSLVVRGAETQKPIEREREKKGEKREETEIKVRKKRGGKQKVNGGHARRPRNERRSRTTREQMPNHVCESAKELNNCKKIAQTLFFHCCAHMFHCKLLLSHVGNERKGHAAARGKQYAARCAENEWQNGLESDTRVHICVQ